MEARLDPLSEKERSERMGKVRSQNTKPEREVRSLIFSLGYRYRLHPSDIPGKPDLVFRKKRKVIFVHGCFWHRHNCPSGKRMPKSKLEFWEPKLEKNKKRDLKIRKNLTDSGWSLLIIWECEIRQKENLKKQILEFLQ